LLKETGPASQKLFLLTNTTLQKMSNICVSLMTNPRHKLVDSHLNYEDSIRKIKYMHPLSVKFWDSVCKKYKIQPHY
jgi:hypothetical protein